MIEVLDSGGLRILGYAVAALAAVAVGLREQRAVRTTGVDRWPTFWYLTAAVLVVMGAARAADIGDLVADLGREQARSSGWYEARRGYQAAAVGVVTAIWAIGVVVAIWRVPERRRRYLPAAIALVTLLCFAAVRLVSLHHVDALLYNRDIAGVRIVSWSELSLLAAMVTTMFWFPFVRIPGARALAGAGA